MVEEGRSHLASGASLIALESLYVCVEQREFGYCGPDPAQAAR